MRLFLISALVVFHAVPAAAQTPDQRDATLKFLASLQAEGGGFVAVKPAAGQPGVLSLRATSAAVRAAKRLGGKSLDDNAHRRFIASCFDPATGGFADRPGEKADVTATAVGLMAVVETQMPLEWYRPVAVKFLAENAKSLDDIRIAAAALEAVQARPPKADDWLAEVVKTQKPDGAFGDGPGAARTTGGMATLVLRLGGPFEHRDKNIAVLKAGQRPDGGFGTAESKESDLESCYRVTRAFVMLKEKPTDVTALRNFIARCRNPDAGYGVTPGKPSTAAGTYYAATLLHWLSEM